MIRFLADENLNSSVILGLRHRVPSVDIVRVIDVGLSGCGDPEILDWAATENRVLITHYISTMVSFAADRIAAGQPMSGVIEIPERIQLRTALDDLELIATLAHTDELDGRVLFLPL